MEPREAKALKAFDLGQSKQSVALVGSGDDKGQKHDREGECQRRGDDRSLKIFRLVGDGLTTQQIVDRLCISGHTIDTHRATITRKLKG